MSRHEAAFFDPENPASPLSVPAKKTALLLMDYQKVQIERGGEQAITAIEKAKSMRDWAAANDFRIWHCLVDMHQPILPTFKGASRFNAIAAMMQSQPDALNEHLDIAPRDRGIEHTAKRQLGHVSALISEGLVVNIRSQGIVSLILCGISTSGVVLSTARAAADEHFIVTVIEDACMDPREGLHETLIQSVLPMQAHVATASEFQKQWDKLHEEDSTRLAKSE